MTNGSIVYAKTFFDLQLRFAHKVSEITDLSLHHTLLDYTNLYIRFGLGRDFQPAHPVWQEYLAGLETATDAGDWTYRFYLSRMEATTGPPVAATFGCFSYALLHEDRIRLHFRNVAGESSLSIPFLAQRREELTALFRHVQRDLSEQTQVVGVSWLYNLEAYRRLFPASYIATARVLADRFRFMPLWGQFLDRHGAVKESMSSPFLECLEQGVNIGRLHECFPFQVITVEAPVREFCDCYGI